MARLDRDYEEGYDDGYDDGYNAGLREGRLKRRARPGGRRRYIARERTRSTRKARSTPKKKRAASAYSKRYGRAFKRLAPKYKKKNGSWKKDGFKRCAAAARRKAKR